MQLLHNSLLGWVLLLSIHLLINQALKWLHLENMNHLLIPVLQLLYPPPMDFLMIPHLTWMHVSSTHALPATFSTRLTVPPPMHPLPSPFFR